MCSSLAGHRHPTTLRNLTQADTRSAADTAPPHDRIRRGPSNPKLGRRSYSARLRVRPLVLHRGSLHAPEHAFPRST